MIINSYLTSFSVFEKDYLQIEKENIDWLEKREPRQIFVESH